MSIYKMSPIDLKTEFKMYLRSHLVVESTAVPMQFTLLHYY